MAAKNWTPDYGWFALFAVCTISFSLIQDLIRPAYAGNDPFVLYLLGILPNFFPAVGLPALFIFTIPYFISEESISKWVGKKYHILAMMISAGGLLIWEFLQHFTPNGIFDWHDVLWTLIGTGCFYWIWKRYSANVKKMTFTK